ncbi:MAG: metal-dependent hydrolase [Methanothrix sp.]|nr:metal-dependent hydrolase [Methanothrix sp.]
MDIFSHALIPYLLGGFFCLDRRLLAVLVLGGIAPDLDTLISWIGGLYPSDFLLVHRGFTHTIFFGFFFALLVFGLASRQPVRTFLSRFIKYDLIFSPASMAFLYAGVLLHLFVDYTTTRGVPLFYPWQAARYSADIFSQIEPAALIASLLVLAELIRERQRITFNKNILILFVVFFLIMGAIRIEGKASAESFFSGQNAEVHPDSNPFSWVVLENESNEFLVCRYDSLTGEITSRSAFAKLTIASDAAEAKQAISAAEELPQVRLFRWRAYAVAINATSEKDGSWAIEYYDPLVRGQMQSSWPAFRPALRGYGEVRVRVDNGEARVEG